MRIAIYGTLALLCLALSTESVSSQIAVNRVQNPWTGRVHTQAVARNPWTGTTAVRNTVYNPWTGRAATNTVMHNPWTGTTVRGGAVANPWTGRVGGFYGARRW
jgi:hypothetical protein